MPTSVRMDYDCSKFAFTRATSRSVTKQKTAIPRFYQTIFTPEMPWRITGVDTLYWTNYTPHISLPMRHIPLPRVTTAGNIITRIRNITTSISKKHLPYNTVAEGLLNFAEAKAELGNTHPG